MAFEEGGYAFNHAGCINAVVINECLALCVDQLYLRLALEVFHYVQELVIDVRIVREAHFDLVKIGQSVSDIQRSIATTVLR